MGLWRPGTVKAEPVVKLTRWQVFSIPSLDRGKGRDHHFNGRADACGDPGRVSSRIVSFNSKKMIGTTRSGRKYQLVGRSCPDPDPEYVWAHWARRNKVDPERVVNVTREYGSRRETCPSGPKTMA